MAVLHDQRAKLVARLCDGFNPVTKALEKLDLLHADFGEIPDAQPCIGCSGQTEKGLVEYEYDYRRSNDARITLAKGLPGYRCVICNAESQSPRLFATFIEAIAEGFAAAGDPRLQDELREPRADPHTIGVISGHDARTR